MNQITYRNPIVPGNYPDPSVCRVGSDYYLINSSFSMFPGIPIFHSTNLVDWRQIGHVLDRTSQLHLTTDTMIAGIMAPTIRYNNGVFYVICTNVSDRWNFIVTATDPAGAWSDPIWLEDMPGIDPSLFFDDDGRCYLTGTREDQNRHGKSQVIWASEIDLKRMKLIGDRPTIWNGALQGAASPEGPHIYKKDGYYYLLIAEGGTEHFHAVTVARSKSVLGYYEGFEGNPVMTHRHLGRVYPVCNIGHADLIATQDGDWYAVMLGSRLVDGYHKPLGRETFLLPVSWEDGWPVFSPGTGKMEYSYTIPLCAGVSAVDEPVRDDFDGDTLSDKWNCYGTPYEPFHTISDSRLSLQLVSTPILQELKPIKHTSAQEKNMDGLASLYKVPAFLGRRQQHPAFQIRAKMRFAAQTENETAGLVVMAANNHQIRLERRQKNGEQVIQLVQCVSECFSAPYKPDFRCTTTETVLCEAIVDGDILVLEIKAKGLVYSFSYGKSEDELAPLKDDVNCEQVFPEIAGMVGTYLGMYASANGTISNNCAAFDWFDYIGISERQ